MIKQIESEDLVSLESLSGVKLLERSDINYSLGGILINDKTNNIESFVVMGKRTLTDYFNGNVPNEDCIDDSEGSQEIIAFYTKGDISILENLYLDTVWSRLHNYSENWYALTDNEETNRTALKGLCLRQTSKGILIRRMY